MYICGRPHISRFPHHTNWKYPLTYFHLLTRYRLQQAPRENTLGACSNESFMRFSRTLVPMNRIAFNMGNQEWAVSVVEYRRAVRPFTFSLKSEASSKCSNERCMR